jgi:nucleoside-diphosphate-sugar epimerase/predicted dehydrogenase
MMKNDSPRIQVGVLGTGYIAEWHLKALRHIPQAHVAALADLDLRRAQSTGAAHNVLNCYGSLDQMLAAEKLDVLHILTPPQTHYEAARTSLKAGVNVLLEKPMCIERHQCAKLSEQARSRGLQVGVNHNFLFMAEYEKLRAAIKAGMIGRVDHVSIVWNKPLAQATSGPFDIWMLRAPQNIVLEVGPHLVAHLFDLVGAPDHWRVHTDRAMELRSGCRFYNRWRIGTERGNVGADLLMSFNAGMTEHYIHVRGSHGTATADFENQTVNIDRPSRYGTDFDRFVRVQRMAWGSANQACRRLAHYAFSKLKLSDRGNSFGHSIQQSLRAFYGAISGKTDDRMSAEFCEKVVGFCEELANEVRENVSAEAEQARSISDRVVFGTDEPKELAPQNGSPPNGGYLTNGSAPQEENPPKILVLGGTGFIGRELVRQLVDQHHRVRVLTRGSGNLGDVYEHPSVELVQGSMLNPESLQSAMSGVDYVFHLARAHVKRWEDYYQADVVGTGMIGDACLRAGVKRLLYTGTIDSYYAGGKMSIIREETGLDPKIRRRNYYARAKCEAESLLLKMHQEQGLPVVIFRPGIVLGSGGSPFHWGVGMWSADTVCQLWGDGDHPLPIVLVSDVAAALAGAMKIPSIEGQSFNLVGDPCLTAREYIQELEKYLNVKLDSLQTPIWRFYLTDMAKWCVKCLVRHPDRKIPSYRDWNSRTQRARFDCTKAKRLLRWNPTTDRVRIIYEAIAQPAEEIGL